MNQRFTLCLEPAGPAQLDALARVHEVMRIARQKGLQPTLVDPQDDRTATMRRGSRPAAVSEYRRALPGPPRARRPQTRSRAAE